MAKKTVEKTINLDTILFNCRDMLRAARNSGSFFEKRDMMLTLVFLRFIGEKYEDGIVKLRDTLISQGLDPDDENIRSAFFDDATFTDGTYNLPKIETFDIDINDKLEYFKFLLEYEIDERRKSVRNKNIAASHIPSIDKEFEYTGIDKWNIEDLKKSNFIEKGQSLIIVGKCGKGKTKL